MKKREIFNKIDQLMEENGIEGRYLLDYDPKTVAEKFFVKELHDLSDEEDVTFQTVDADYFKRKTDLDNSFLRFQTCAQDDSVSIIELEEIRNPDKGVTAIGAWIEWAKCGFLIKF